MRYTRTFWLTVVLFLLLPLPLAAHHPIGIPQYRAQGELLVVIYNVPTEDYVVRFLASPGRPAYPENNSVAFSVQITPKDGERTFIGGTYFSVAEELGERGARDLMPPRKHSDLRGERHFEESFTFGAPGQYTVKVEFTESPGREILEFPFTVSGGKKSPAGPALILGAGVVLIAAILLAARAAKSRRSEI